MNYAGCIVNCINECRAEMIKINQMFDKIDFEILTDEYREHVMKTRQLLIDQQKMKIKEYEEELDQIINGGAK